MSSPRLLFLYPSLLRSVCQQEVRTSIRPLRKQQTHAQRSAFASAPLRGQEAFAQRYGTAQEPPPPSQSLSEGSKTPISPPDDKSLASAIEQEVKGPEQEVKGPEQEAPRSEPVEQPEESAASLDREKPTQEDQKDQESLGPLEDRGKAIEFAAKDPAERVRQLDKSATSSSPPVSASVSVSKAPSEDTDTKPPASPSSQEANSGLLSTVMEMPAPTVEKPEERKIPHLQTPPYVHHFDTYTLVQDLEKGGFSPKQSEATMKGMRSLLGVNMDVARESLVSKSDVENETYLFRAACSELRTEILNLRRSTTSKQKSQLSHLQHTFDILSQRTTSELASLRDELKGMLNDRRMDNRQNSQSLDSSISEINYKIGTRFGGDAKSGVEGLRWVMTRRSAMAFGAMVFMIIGSLWYGSRVVHERERREKEGERRSMSSSSGGGFTVQSRDTGTQTQTEGPERRVEGKEGDVGYVSLG